MPDSTIIRKRVRISIRTITLIATVAVLASFIGDYEAVRVLFIACQAAFATTVIATVAQWAFTAMNFTDTKVTWAKNHEPGNDYVDEMIVAGRIRTLGMIYLGVSIVVGLVYFATYRGIF